MEFPLPAVLTIDEGLNKERLPSLRGIMAAKKKPLEVKPVTLAESRIIGAPPATCRPSAPRAASSARARRPCPSSFACSRPRPRSCDAEPSWYLRRRAMARFAKSALEAVDGGTDLLDASGGGEVHAAARRAAGHRGQSRRAWANTARISSWSSSIRRSSDTIPRRRRHSSADRIRSGGYRAGVFSSTAQGRDLAPRVAGDSRCRDRDRCDRDGDRADDIGRDPSDRYRQS